MGCDRISDQGGGIAPEDLTKVWQYGYTTIEHQDSSRYQGTSDLDPIWATRPESSAQYRMGGLGFGLPMSRLYAEYFGEWAGSGMLLSMFVAGACHGILYAAVLTCTRAWATLLMSCLLVLCPSAQADWHNQSCCIWQDAHIASRLVPPVNNHTHSISTHNIKEVNYSHISLFL